MTVDDVSMITQEALILIIKVSAPVLLISLAVGLLISIFQTVTSIQEQTLTFVPKIISIFLAIMLSNDSTNKDVEETLFDIIIKDDLIKNNGDNSLLSLRLYYERFCKNRTENTPKIILKNLIKIAKNYKPYQQ